MRLREPRMRRSVPSIAALSLALLGCSVVEKHTYFTAAVEPSLLSGPDRRPCAWTNFASPPDRVTYRAGERWVSIDAEQDLDPYLFGPWFASVVPVFPVTWLVKGFSRHYLTLTFDGDPATLRSLRSIELLVLIPTEPKPLQVMGTFLGRYAPPNQARFPVDSRRVNLFTLRLPQVGNLADDFDIPFVKARRWAWVELTPYC